MLADGAPKLCMRMQAVKRLQETLTWRREADVESIACSACLADPRAHYMHPVGFDRLGRPVLYSCLQLAANRSAEDNRAHMIATFEQVCAHHGLSHPPHRQMHSLSNALQGFGSSAASLEKRWAWQAGLWLRQVLRLCERLHLAFSQSPGLSKCGPESIVL